MDFNLDIRNILVLIVTILNFTIGYLIYFRNKKNTTNLNFFLFTLTVGFWGASMFFFRSSTSVNSAEFFSRELYFWASLIPLSFIYFIYFFPEGGYLLKKWQKFLLPIPAVAAAFMALCPGVLVLTINFINGGETAVIFNKAYYVAYIIYMVAYFNYAYFLLFRKFFNQQKGAQRSQIGYVIIGTLLTTLIGTVTNLLAPFWGYFELNWFGQVGLIAMIGAIAYAILKYQLFNIKLILVELAILLLNFFLFINIFLSHGTGSLIFNASVFLGIMLFSLFLVRGIYKDIRDREKIFTLAKEMEEANERLRMMEGQKTEFVSIASHQLRTPLTVIKGYTSMILEGTFGPITDSVRDAVEKLYKSSEKIVALVEDLLTVSRIEQGRMMLVFETVDFKEFIQKVLEEAREEIEESKLELSFTIEDGEGFKVLLDEKKFKQVIAHIIENATKYTRAPGKIRIFLTEDDVTNKVRLAISDTGVGMTADQIYAVFERFNMKSNLDAAGMEKEADSQLKNGVDVSKEQDHKEEIVEAEMMKKRTPGIGLYIAQEIIEAHHGTLSLESAGVDKGTTVIVELPKVVEIRS